MKTSAVESFQPSPIYEAAARIAVSHKITAAEQSVLMDVILEHPLNEEENRIINRLYYSLRRGHIRLVS